MSTAIDQDDLDELLFWSFRYALPRQSYAVSSVADLVTKYRQHLSEQTRARIVSEIREACERSWLTPEDQRRWQELQQVLGERPSPEEGQ